MEGKYIEGYGKDYKICKNGDVISCRFNKEKILKPGNNTWGYLQVGLYKNNKLKTFRIHRLIALHFIDNPNNYECVDHVNRNKRDNRIENLRWITQSGNKRNTKNYGKYMKGVSFNKASNKFQAQIYFDNKSKYLGCFKTELEAHNVYMKAYNEIMKKFKNI